MGGFDRVVPRPRREGLIVERLRGETLIYDEGRDEAHCLTGVAAAVFELCEGARTRADLAVLASERTGEPVDELMVDEVIGELGARGLVADQPKVRRGLSRRQVIRRGALVGAGAAMITTIAAPTPALAVSGQTCTTSSECPSGQVCSSGRGVCCVPIGGTCASAAECCGGRECSGGQCRSSE